MKSIENEGGYVVECVDLNLTVVVHAIETEHVDDAWHIIVAR